MDLEFSDPSIGSDTEYVRVTGLAKWLLPLSERQQLLLRLQLGMIWSQDFNQVPVSARFFAGGDQSIRGYGYNTLGPRDESGALIGGSRLAVSSAEYLYRFLPNWQAALFVDHGGAMDETTESTDTGAGVGLRWLSPLGVIGFDLANAVSDDNSYRVHITMGTVL
jgi:translocation and assembly module TamA